MNIFPKNILPTAEVKKFVLIFYSIGALGFLIPWSRGFFIAITPFALLMSIYLLAIYHTKYRKKDIVLFLAIAILAYFIEVIGVNTGLIFGKYNYGNALGIKLLNTPLLIALNWLFLIYSANSVSEIIIKKPAFQIILAPTIMLIYDIILEQLAPKMDMWIWEHSVVPTKNYIAWWIIGFLFICLIKIAKIETKNPLAVVLFFSQFVFFVLLYTVFYLFI